MSDLIDREDAIKALRLEYPMMPSFKAMREEWVLRTEGFRRAEEVIMRLPSADRPRGEWIDEAISIIDDMQREGIVDYQQAWEFRMRARMKGADDE